jgi:aldehyde:ferredoxin oxidoreductase
VELPKVLPGAPEKAVVIDQPVANITELRAALCARLPEAREALDDPSWNVAVNNEMALAGERNRSLVDGDRVMLVPIVAGG